AQALERLARDVQAAGPAGIRLAAWRQGDKAALAMAPHVWLVFAVMALRGRRMRVELLRCGPREGEHFAHGFDDALACAEALAAAAPPQPCAAFTSAITSATELPGRPLAMARQKRLST
ncbi:MAG: hypothetical protein M3R45_16395, partial [Pseudomonadota bacterium]|nr:hypothetical protein [Pseudomonadota bacterium]